MTPQLILLRGRPNLAFAMLCDISGNHMKAYGYGNVMMSYDSCQRLLYHVGDLSVSLCCRLDILMR
jgi:hypothetical protein